ncbi:phospholipase [Dysgonomonas sp. GY617]|uniref:phospholipase n=1 Tax=Dysgonomonas sp. GY617 TaxID=2780420 RepID=UPI001883F701|nr:phospholipase [Dysgonomonas sp. GY617]MBF0577820.1 phospholipase [Dysgonomonas sp. GY617]
MEILFIFLGIIIFFVIALFVWNSYQRKQGNTERAEIVNSDPIDGTCCGQHATCEQDSLLNCFVEESDYFDDEELDKYKKYSEEDYTAQEVDEFREVFYTLLDEDKPRWVRSLQQREIPIPNELKDEILLIINDLRSTQTTNA